MPRYVRGVGTMVSVSDSSPADGEDGERTAPYFCCRRLGDVKVAICARRRTVSKGNRTASSTPEPKSENRFHREGCKTGSMDK